MECFDVCKFCGNAEEMEDSVCDHCREQWAELEGEDLAEVEE